MAIRLNLPSNGKRLIYDLSAFGLPEIPYLAAQNLPFTATGLPPHSHGERMEINLIIKGERIYRVGGKDYLLRGNHIFITWPDEIHGSGKYLHGRGQHFWMQVVVPKPGSPFLFYNAKRAAPLLRAIWGITRRQFHSDPAMRDIYAKILAICGLGVTERAGVELSALLTQWFLLLADAASREWEDEVTPDIARALHLMEDPFRNITIGDLAEAACLSESRFKGKFRDQIGMPPGEYLLRRRTEMAADVLLRGGKSLTEIAYDAGFSSSQHFSITFKKFFGASPHAWLKRQDDNGLLRGVLAAGDIEAAGELQPWVDNDGLLHGYVSKSHSGKHPDT